MEDFEDFITQEIEQEIEHEVNTDLEDIALFGMSLGLAEEICETEKNLNTKFRKIEKISLKEATTNINGSPKYFKRFYKYVEEGIDYADI